VGTAALGCPAARVYRAAGFCFSDCHSSTVEEPVQSEIRSKWPISISTPIQLDNRLKFLKCQAKKQLLCYRAQTLSYLDSTTIAFALIAYGDPEACL
jgi:hypothetical protein